MSIVNDESFMYIFAFPSMKIHKFYLFQIVGIKVYTYYHLKNININYHQIVLM
jgi:hypothetical protein